MNSAGESFGTLTAANGVQESQHEQRHPQQPQQHQQHGGAMPGGPSGNGSSTAMLNGRAGPHEQQHNPPQHDHNAVQRQPTASTSASPTKPPSNKIRKRQKVEYDPVKRFYSDHAGTWDAVQVEEVVSHALSKRQKRTARDLGRQSSWHFKERL
jgi:hypothetical protein